MAWDGIERRSTPRYAWQWIKMYEDIVCRAMRKHMSKEQPKVMAAAA